MAESVLPKPDPRAYENLIRAQAAALHTKDTPPTSKREWALRQVRLREAMFAAMGPFPDKPSSLESKELGALKRQGYRIEKLIFQSRPDVWVTANAYVPEPAKEKLPAVLAGYGPRARGRRDPVGAGRCLGVGEAGVFLFGRGGVWGRGPPPLPLPGAFP